MVLSFVSCGKHVDWSSTFDSKDKIPFGTHILHRELPKMFPEVKRHTVSEHLDDYFFLADSGNYIKIEEYMLLDSLDWQSLQEFVYKGNKAFLAFNYRSNIMLLKNLELELTSDDSLADKNKIDYEIEGKGHFELINEKGISGTYFSKVPQDSHVMGYQNSYGEKQPNFIEVKYGEGHFLLHAEPYVFTNYHLLYNNSSSYVASVLSYLDNADIHWDNHSIFRRKREGADTTLDDNGSLAFLMQNPPLKMAWQLLIAMGILFLLFNYKRKQKPHTILTGFTNSTVDFSQTLAHLLARSVNHQALALKKIAFFSDQLRRHFYLEAGEWPPNFAHSLSQKTSVDLELCRHLVSEVQQVRNREISTKTQFFDLQEHLNNFREKAKIYE